MAEKGGLCFFLGEECCFHANQSGLVRDILQKLSEHASRIRQQLSESWGNWSQIYSLASWLLPLAGPLLIFLLALLFGSCLLNLLIKFVSSRLKSIEAKVLLSIELKPLPTNESAVFPGPLDGHPYCPYLHHPDSQEAEGPK